MGNPDEQGDGGQHRARKRQDDPHEDLKIAVPVNAGGLFQFFGYALQKGSDNDDVHEIEQHRQNIHPEAVDQMQLLQRDEERDKPGTENRRQKDVKGKKRAARQCLFGKRIGHERTQHDMKECPQHGAHERNLVRLPDAGIIEYLRVVLQREFTGQKINRPHHRILSVIKGIGQNVNKRINHGKSDDGEDGVIEHREKRPLTFHYVTSLEQGYITDFAGDAIDGQNQDEPDDALE